MVVIQRIKCPNRQCRKRVCDIGMMALDKIIVELKCPHCGKIVRVYIFSKLKCKEHIA